MEKACPTGFLVDISVPNPSAKDKLALLEILKRKQVKKKVVSTVVPRPISAKDDCAIGVLIDLSDIGSSRKIALLGSGHLSVQGKAEGCDKKDEEASLGKENQCCSARSSIEDPRTDQHDGIHKGRLSLGKNVLDEEKFDFDLPVSPTSSVGTPGPRNVKAGMEEDEEEIFFGPVGHKEKCIAVAVEEVEETIRPASLTDPELDEIMKEAQNVAWELRSAKERSKSSQGSSVSSQEPLSPRGGGFSPLAADENKPAADNASPKRKLTATHPETPTGKSSRISLDFRSPPLSEIHVKPKSPSRDIAPNAPIGRPSKLAGPLRRSSSLRIPKASGSKVVAGSGRPGSRLVRPTDCGRSHQRTLSNSSAATDASAASSDTSICSVVSNPEVPRLRPSLGLTRPAALGTAKGLPQPQAGAPPQNKPKIVSAISKLFKPRVSSSARGSGRETGGITSSSGAGPGARAAAAAATGRGPMRAVQPMRAVHPAADAVRTPPEQVGSYRAGEQGSTCGKQRHSVTRRSSMNTQGDAALRRAASGSGSYRRSVGTPMSASSTGSVFSPVDGGSLQPKRLVPNGIRTPKRSNSICGTPMSLPKRGTSIPTPTKRSSSFCRSSASSVDSETGSPALQSNVPALNDSNRRKLASPSTHKHFLRGQAIDTHSKENAGSAFRRNSPAVRKLRP